MANRRPTASHSSPQELAPSSRIINAFPRPLTFRVPERPTPNNQHRSVDSTLLLGSMDDVNPDDPVLILWCAVSYYNLTSRHRLSAPLNELALHKFHCDSYSSASSSDPNTSHDFSMGCNKQPILREIITCQREAIRANQRAILSAQSNSVQGMDVLPGNAMLRSSRYSSTDCLRYSYVEPDREIYDISNIVEEELRDNGSTGRNNILESVLGRKDAVGEKLNRVLSKIKSEQQREEWAARSSLDGSRRSASNFFRSIPWMRLLRTRLSTGSRWYALTVPTGNGDSNCYWQPPYSLHRLGHVRLVSECKGDLQAWFQAA